MSLADEFLRDAGSQAQGSLSSQFEQDLSGPPVVPRRPLQKPEELSGMDKLLAKVPTGLVNNPAVAGARNIATMAAAPIVGGAQLIANAMPESTGAPELYNRKAAEMLRKNAAAAKENPATAGVNEFIGGMISPANLAMGANAAPAVTAGARAVQGGAIGAAAGATTPVEVGESGKYWGPKGAQIALGTTGGVVLAPLMGAIGDRVLARLNRGTSANPAKDADEIIGSALKESNQKLEDIPTAQLEGLRAKVIESLSKDKRLDAAAALRKADFAAERIQPTQGQITRDPMQFADEQTMKAISRPLSLTMESGNKKVIQGIGQYGANAAEGPAAATKIADALRKYDTGKEAAVTSAYKSARESEGKDLLMPTDSLMTKYREVVSDFEDKVPKAVQSKFERLGFQFSFEDADKLRKAINDHVGNDTTTNKALGRLREALNAAQSSADVAGGPFAPAVKLARERFTEHEQIPGLNAAVTKDAGDNFVQKYVVNGETADVKKLAAVLRTQAPEAFQETRQQIGAELARKAFGENVAGDKPIAQESYNKALRNMGTEKLEAFFEPHEVEQLKRLGRIGAYQQSNPAAAASNFSNSAGALANLLRSGGGIPFAGKSLQFAGEKLGGYAAIHPEVPVTANLTPEQRAAMSKALLALTGGASIALPSRVIGQ